MAEDGCPICFGELGSLETIQFGCQHRFCSVCAVAWLTRGNAICPQCTQRVFDPTGVSIPNHWRARSVRTLLVWVFEPWTNFVASLGDVLTPILNILTIFIQFVLSVLGPMLTSVCWTIPPVIVAEQFLTFAIPDVI